MKLQISLELELYLALAGIALFFSFLLFKGSYSYIAGDISGYKIMEFSSALNDNLLAGNTHFTAYLPPGLCNSSAKGNEIITRYGTFYIPGRLLIENGTFCPDSETAIFYLLYNASSSSMVLRR